MCSRPFVLAAALALFCTGPALASAPAPRVSIASLHDLPVVQQKPYDEKADANVAVAAAFARAKASGKRVLIDLGGNWCGDCIVLANLMQLPEMRPFLSAHYEIVLVDVGRFNRNLQIPARFGIKTRMEGVPAILVAEPGGTLVNTGHVVALDDARHMSPQAIADWLAEWTK